MEDWLEYLLNIHKTKQNTLLLFLLYSAPDMSILDC